jgi:hypothetical protein
MAGGVSANVATGDLARGLSAARAEAAANPNAPSSPDTTYAKGALVSAGVGPGVAPYVGARVGVGNRFEGGITYTARTARIDMRRSFDRGPWSLSLGAGGSFVLLGQEGSELPNVDLNSLHGYGADVPVLVGYESEAGLYMLWLGLRGGWEHESIDLVRTIDQPGSLQPPNLSADRFYGGGLVGIAAGFRHVHAALELDASYMTISGSFAGASATVAGLSLAPASALWFDF